MIWFRYLNSWSFLRSIYLITCKSKFPCHFTPDFNSDSPVKDWTGFSALWTFTSSLLASLGLYQVFYSHKSEWIIFIIARSMSLKITHLLLALITWTESIVQLSFPPYCPGQTLGALEWDKLHRGCVKLADDGSEQQICSTKSGTSNSIGITASSVTSPTWHWEHCTAGVFCVVKQTPASYCAWDPKCLKEYVSPIVEGGGIPTVQCE